MTTRELLHKLIDEIDDDRANALVILLGGGMAGSSNVSGTDVEGDPFWGLVDLIGDDYDGPTDVSTDVHRYVADAIEGGWKS